MTVLTATLASEGTGLAREQGAESPPGGGRASRARPWRR